MHEQCDPAAGTQIRIKDDPIGPCCYYEIDGHLSAAHYADAQSALADARRRQYADPNGRIEPAGRVLFVLAMRALGISACHDGCETTCEITTGNGSL